MFEKAQNNPLLVRKQITNSRGIRTTVWVKPNTGNSSNKTTSAPKEVDYFGELSDKDKNILKDIPKDEANVLLMIEEHPVSTGETRVDKDYDIGDPERNQRLVKKPFYSIAWDKEHGTGATDIRYEDDLVSAISAADETRDYENARSNHYNSVTLYLKDVWIDENGDEVEDGGEEEAYTDWAYRNKEHPLVKKLGLDWEYIKDHGSREGGADDLLRQAENELHGDLDGMRVEANGNDYTIEVSGKGKYSSLNIINSDGDDVDSIKLRIADHSYNPRNNDGGYFISVNVANKNETEGRFGGIHNYNFDETNDYDEILDAVKERIQEIVEMVDVDQDV